MARCDHDTERGATTAEGAIVGGERIDGSSERGGFDTTSRAKSPL
jgi:hypothetical protein